jgi:hypothetical protein
MSLGELVSNVERGKRLDKTGVFNGHGAAKEVVFY